MYRFACGMKELAALILLAAVLALLAIANRHDPHPLLIQSAAVPCAKLPNPCATTDCNRVRIRTEKIA